MRGLPLFLVVGLFACKKADDLSSAAKPAPLKPVKVAKATATMTPTPEVLTITGTIAADQRSDVTADTQGKVISVSIERGDRVKFGQGVIQLDVRSAALGAREAQAQLATARVQKQLAEQECARTKSLLEKGAITKSEYDRQTTQCASALEQVSAAEARAQMMGKSVADGVVRAPFEGIVAEKMVSPGEWVTPGKPLFTLVDDKPLKIELSVPEGAIQFVHPGQRVEIRAVARPNNVYQAKVTRVGGEIGKSRSLIVEAELAPTDELVPGMFAEASIVVGDRPHLVIPASAVKDSQDKKTKRVFVVKPQPSWGIVQKYELEERIVQLGYPPSPDQATVLLGLESGEQVVSKLDDSIVDGAPVQE